MFNLEFLRRDIMKQISLLLMILVSVLVFVPCIMAADIPEISTADLKNRLDARENMLLVNALSEIEFTLQHIPGSVNIPVGEILTTKKLPQDKQTLLIFY